MRRRGKPEAMRQLEIKQHSDGVYYARPYLGTNAITKKPLRPYKRFPEAKTADEALAMAQEWIDTIAAASDLHVSRRLDELLYRYIDHLEAIGRSPNTIKTYRSNVRCYITPYLHDLDADDLKPYQIDGLYEVILFRGGRGGKSISSTKLTNIHWMLRGAYRWFVKEGITEFNPLLSVDRPSVDTSSAIAYNESEFALIDGALRKIMSNDALDDESIFRRNVAMAAFIALNTGERCGEVTANTREDAQLARKIMHVGATSVEAKGDFYRKPFPKRGSTRNPAIEDDLISAIRNHYTWQEGYLKNPTPKTTICTMPDGSMMRPSKVSAAYSELRDEIGLPKESSFHTLRHTHATWLLLRGIDLREIAERLGHKNFSTTLALYAHVMPGRDAEAARVFSDTRREIGGDL